MLASVTSGSAPPLVWAVPFAALLLSIAVLPLVPRTAHWWERNVNKLLVGLILAGLTLVHYQIRGYGTVLHEPSLASALMHVGLGVEQSHGHVITTPGLPSLAGALGNALFEYIPFIVLLFALYCIAGGIAVRGDVPAHPLTNTAILALGGLLANLIGTTGASMVLIRPLLQINCERKHVAHSVVFFIFIVSNVGGALLPIGDPPLFLGYLRGVPFFWTLNLWGPWAFTLAILLAVYVVWDLRAYRREAPRDVARDERTRTPFSAFGLVNLLWLALVILVVAGLSPAAALPGTNWVPPPFTREAVLLMLVGLSFWTTPTGVRRENRFTFHAIAEVACLFIGIFITMQPPLEILSSRAGDLGLTQAWQFFWATGALSGVLDNAPTYAVFFQAADALTPHAGAGVLELVDGSLIREDFLTAVSLGAVFMGASTYIGNGPNFMVKSIAQQRGIRTPSFFAYTLLAAAVLGPIYALVAWIFL